LQFVLQARVALLELVIRRHRIWNAIGHASLK
jgi:hypothetical protein